MMQNYLSGYLFIYYLFFYFCHAIGLWDHSSLTRDRTCIPCIGTLHPLQSLDHWTSREVPWCPLKYRVSFPPCPQTPLPHRSSRTLVLMLPNSALPFTSQPTAHTPSTPLLLTWNTATTPVVQPLSRVRFFVTPWTAAHQASLSITNSWSLLKLKSIESDAIQSSHPLSSPSPPALNLSQHQSLFQ